jgi:hypothetical protein
MKSKQVRRKIRVRFSRRKVLGLLTAGPALACTSDETPSAASGSGGSTMNSGGLGGDSSQTGSSISGSSSTGLPVIGEAPAWFVNATDGAWIEIAAGPSREDLADALRGATIAEVAPDPIGPNAHGAEGITAVTNDWTGGCLLQARGEYILPAQGGHNGYYGNEVYALAFREEKPAWKRVWGPTPDALIETDDFPLNAPFTGYQDGAPRTSHGWFQIQASQSDERIWILMVDACPSGNWTSETYSLPRGNIAAGWTFHGRLWDDIGGASDFFYQSGPSAYDAVTHRIWKAAESSNISPSVVSVDIATCVAAGLAPSSGPVVSGLTGYFNGGEFLADGWSAIAQRGGKRVWIIGSPVEERIYLLDLDNPEQGLQPKDVSGAPPPQWGARMGAVFHPGSSAVLVGGLQEENLEDGRIWKLSVPEDPLTGSYSWTTVSPVGTSPRSVDDYRGTYSKWQLIDDMGNGQSAIVYVSSVRGATYVFKIPMSGVA